MIMVYPARTYTTLDELNVIMVTYRYWSSGQILSFLLESLSDKPLCSGSQPELQSTNGPRTS
jgi:hypothetical protein